MNKGTRWPVKAKQENIYCQWIFHLTRATVSRAKKAAGYIHKNTGHNAVSYNEIRFTMT